MMRQPVTAVPASPACAVHAQQHPRPDPRSMALAEDDTLAAMYLRMWFLATGRRLQSGLRLELLTEDELVDFWAEDLSPGPGGRHAARGADAARDSL